ncbi:MAG: FtsX-like permease family protein [Sarcina sp.]
MLLKNNNIGVKRVFDKLYKENKVKNIYTLISIFLTSLLLTSVSVVGFNMYSSNEKFLEITKEVQSIQLTDALPFIFGILLVMFSGYLIIYNIFYISIVKEIRLYGQLKIIGFTFKQIKSLVYKWGMKITTIALPLALIIGGMIGHFLTSIVLGETFLGDYIVKDFNVIPYIIGTIFTYITVYIAVSKPAKLASKTTAIQAINYNSSDLVKSNKKSKQVKKSKKGAKIKGMAFANMLKNKTKVIIYSLSIGISSTLVVFAIIVGVGLDVEEHTDRYLMNDIDISNNQSPYMEKFDEGILAKIKSTSGIDEVVENKTVISYSPFGIEPNIQITRNEKISSEFDMYKDAWNMVKTPDFIQTSVAGVKSKSLVESVKRHKLVDGKIDIEKFKTGNYIIIKRDNNKLNGGLKSGENVNLEFRVTDKNGKEKVMKESMGIMAIVAPKDENYTSSSLGTITLEENKLMSLFGEENIDISSLAINTGEGMESSVEKEVEKIIEGKALLQTSKNSFLSGISNMKGSILLGSGIVAFIFGLIAAINVLNTTISDLMIRKREFGMLEAIGMTKKEQMRLLMFEGMYKIILISIIIIPLGFVAAIFAPMMIPIYGGFNLGAYLFTVCIVIGIISIMVIFIPMIVFKSIIQGKSIIEKIKED